MFNPMLALANICLQMYIVYLPFKFTLNIKTTFAILPYIVLGSFEDEPETKCGICF